MDEKELIEKLRLSGLALADMESVGGRVLECRPSYRGNFGFHFVMGEGLEAILLKGVYKDFVRIVKGGAGISEKDWSEAAKLLNDAESAIGLPLNTSIALNNSEAKIISASISEEKPIRGGDMRDYQIPRPLTPVEYAAPASKLYDESVMLSSGFIGSIFPETLSPFSVSVLEKIPDALNPIFVSCNLKTSSPSAVSVYGRAMTNVNAFEKMLKACGTGSAIFRASYAPSLYLKKQTVPERINKSYFPVETDEITELLEDIKRTIPHISTTTIVEDSYVEYPIKLAICAEYVFIKLADGSARLRRYFPDFSGMLSAVFRTRPDSIFFRGEPLTLPVYLDYASRTVQTAFSCEKPSDTIESAIKKIPFTKRFGASGKIRKIISEMHMTLDLRDEIYLVACSFIEKSNQVLKQLADFGIKKDRLKNPEEIYLFEHSEVRRIAFDSFFGDTAHTINFRRWLWDRYAAQVLPTEIYGRDLEQCPKISEQMITKALNLAEFSPLSLFAPETEIEAEATAKTGLEDYKGYFIAASRLPLPLLERYKNAEAFILEEAPLFGFTAEYACLKGIPVYTGVRFAPLVLDGVKLKASKNKLSKA